MAEWNKKGDILQNVQGETPTLWGGEGTFTTQIWPYFLISQYSFLVFNNIFLLILQIETGVSSAKKSLWWLGEFKVLLIKAVITSLPLFTACVANITSYILMWLKSSYSIWYLSPCLFCFTLESSKPRVLSTTWQC